MFGISKKCTDKYNKLFTLKSLHRTVAGSKRSQRPSKEVHWNRKQDADDLNSSHFAKHRCRSLPLNPVRGVERQKHADSVANNENDHQGLARNLTRVSNYKLRRKLKGHTGLYESSEYVTATFEMAATPNACIAYPNAGPIQCVLCATHRPKIRIPAGPITPGMTMAGSRYSGIRTPPFRAVLRVDMISISRPPR